MALLKLSFSRVDQDLSTGCTTGPVFSRYEELGCGRGVLTSASNRLSQHLLVIHVHPASDRLTRASSIGWGRDHSVPTKIGQGQGQGQDISNATLTKLASHMIDGRIEVAVQFLIHFLYLWQSASFTASSFNW